MSNVPNEPFHSVPTPEQPAADRPVAVIAIHGVGKHPPGASAEAISTLLLNIGRENGVHKPHDPPPYSGFESKSVDVALHPVQTPHEVAFAPGSSGPPSRWSKIWNMFDERRGFLCERRRKGASKTHSFSPEPRLEEPDRGEFGYQFMRTQLVNYRGEPDRTFSTARLEGQARTATGSTVVHIYDSHYSDLSKPQNGIVRFLFALYQLLFHLASLSMQAIYWAEAENAPPGDRLNRWGVLATLHAISIRMLVMWIPILNLTLLALGLAAFSDKFSTRSATAIGMLLAAAFGIAVTFVLRRDKSSPPRPLDWALIPFLGAAAGILVLLGLAHAYQFLWAPALDFGKILLLLTGLAVTGAAIFWITSKFEAMRPGSFKLSIFLYSVNVALFFGMFLHKAAQLNNACNEGATAAFWSVQLVFGELSLCWIACLVCALLSWPVGEFCSFRMENQDQKARARAAMRTGRLAFAIPALLFLVVTLSLWTALVVTGSDKLKIFDHVTHAAVIEGPSSWVVASYVIPDVCYLEAWMDHASGPIKGRIIRRRDALSHCGPSLEYGGKQAPLPDRPWSTYLRGLLLISITPGLPLTLLLATLGFFLLTWAVLPSLKYEVSPNPNPNFGDRESAWLGEWLSRGLDSTAIVTRMLWFAIVPIPILFGVLDWLVWNDLAPEGVHRFTIVASRLTLPILQQASIAISATAIYGVGLKYLGTVLDTLLDVDNYLRTSPADLAPRARIAERVTSLLRYIGAYRDAQGRPYAKVVVVAHSLGTLVITDLFRYLHRTGLATQDRTLAPFGFGQKQGQAPIPVYLMTMGSPLRQLMNRFFPHLYWWLTDRPDNSLGNPLGPAAGVPIPAINPQALPRTDEMRVKGWLNIYRSGDYVGRSLWIGQWLRHNATTSYHHPAAMAMDVNRERAEMCIGLGSHTHYWDRTAPDVGAALDKLITNPPGVFL